MELTVTDRRENALLGRAEVHFVATHPDASTPTRGDLKKALGAVLNAKKEVIVLDWARSEYGTNVTKGYAKIYASKERARTVETHAILLRNGLVEKEATAEAKPEAETTEAA